jgi:threonine dehydratase/peptide deformylase
MVSLMNRSESGAAAAGEERAILVEGDPRLRTRALPVVASDGSAAEPAELDRAIAQLFATLAGFRRAHGFGRGLAAPQIGIARRIIAIDLGAGPFVLIDPEIDWRSPDRFELWDDCFSVPDKLVRVVRHRSISLGYRDAMLRPRRWDRLPPDLAELVQHEVDHLDGVLMTDRAVEGDSIRPAAARRALIDPARPAHRLSLARIEDAARQIDPVFLGSPQFVCEPLSEQLGCSVRLKIETLNPIRSFKGRGTGLFVAEVMSRIAGGAPPVLVCASAGNFGQGLAYACRPRGIPLVVFAARDANPLKLARMQSLGAELQLVGEDFDAAKQAASDWASARGATLVVDGLEPRIAEGAGTIARELFAEDPACDAVYLPVGNGALITGMARWIKARSPATRVIGVCSRGAPAMAQAFWAGRTTAASGAAPRTIADGIAVRVAIPEAVSDMIGLVDEVVLVDDAELIEAMRLLHRHAGVVVEPAGAAGLAAIAATPGLAGRSVATVACGGNLTPEQVTAWLG